MATINIGTEINLEDLLQSRMLIQANSGGGKSVLARVIIEETFGKVPFIVMDIEGEYYTLKEKYGDVLIIGGQHADIPISMKSVKLLPKEIISNRLSVVIDLSDLQMSDRIMYSKYFLETMMDLPKDCWINYLVFIEEAHKLCGEQDKQASATAVKDLMSRGRKRGYCGILLTQRISKLHKDAAAECNNKFIGKTFLDLDIDRAAKELGWSTGADKNILRELKPGTFYAFGTSILPNHVHQVKINLPKTKIVKAGANLDIKPKAPTEKIKSMLAKLNDLPAEADKELKTMLQLQAEVKRLNAELRTSTLKKFGEIDKNAMDKLRKEITGLQQQTNSKDQEIASLKKAIATYERRSCEVAKILNDLGEKLTDSHSANDRTISIKNVTKSIPFVPKNDTSVQISPKVSTQQTASVRNVNKSSGDGLPPGEQKILTACAQFPGGLRRDQLTVLTSYKRSTRDRYILYLKDKGFVRQDSDKIYATDEGIAILGSDFQPLPTGEALRQYWLEKLPPGEKAILECLISVYPSPMKRDDLSERTGYMRSTRDRYLLYMQAKEIVLIVGPGEVKAADELFN
jgi:archaellum component FlaG (FlaF/FlaG flagellin family)